MRQTIAERLEFFKRVMPNIDYANARFMYSRESDLSKRGRSVVLYTILWSSDGRVSLHSTGFSHKSSLSVQGWAAELGERAPFVLRERVIPGINMQTGVSWGLDRVVGWHFTKPKVSQRNSRRGRR